MVYYRWSFWTWLYRSTGCHATTGSCRWKCWNTSRLTSRQPYWTTSIVLPDMVSYSAGRYLVKAAFITSTTDLQHTSTRLCSTEDSQWIRRLLLTCVKQRLLVGLGITSWFLFVDQACSYCVYCERCVVNAELLRSLFRPVCLPVKHSSGVIQQRPFVAYIYTTWQASDMARLWRNKTARKFSQSVSPRGYYVQRVLKIAIFDQSPISRFISETIQYMAIITCDLVI